MAAGGIVLEQHHGAEQLSGWMNTYETALQDPCTKAHGQDHDIGLLGLFNVGRAKAASETRGEFDW
jgi:hypothetical protein